MKCHLETTERLRSQFNPVNAKLELYFVDISDVGGNRVICVGTSDGRVLFFIGQDLNYVPVQLPENYVTSASY